MSNTINITNLHINSLYLCLGGTQNFNKNGDAENLEKVRIFDHASDEPANGDPHWVIPDLVNTGYGSICAKITYQVARTNVKALVVQELADPAHPPICPLNLAPNGKSADYLVWTWGKLGATNLIPGVKHDKYGVLNYLRIWYEDSTAINGYKYDGATTFYGVTGNGSINCGGYGSPSGSGTTTPLPGEFQSGIVITAYIPDGESNGTHVLIPSGYLKWKAVIAKNIFEFSVGSCGKKMIVESNNQQVYSTEFSSLPFYATFEGKIFHSSHPVLLVLK